MEALAASDIQYAFKKSFLDAPDASLIAACLQVCNRFNLTPDEFADQLDAFICGPNKTLTLNLISKFEEEIRGNSQQKKPRMDMTSKRPAESKAAMQTPAAKRKIDYSAATVTPTATKIEHDVSSVLTPSQSGSTVGKESNFANRLNSGEVVASHNESLGKRGEFTPSDLKPLGLRTQIAVSDEDFDNVKQRYRYMFTSLEERFRAANKHFEKMQAALCEAAQVSADELHPVGTPSQSNVWVCGRICCESGASKMNSTSVQLEGGRDSNGRRVYLDLSALPAYALFPGQIVLVEGVNSTGRKMVAKRIVEGSVCAHPKSLPGELIKYHHSSKHQGGEPLKVFTAAGPFTTSDNLLYEPFEHLLGKTLQEKPDVLILIGPFVDVSQPLLAGGDVHLEDGEGNAHSASYEMVFIEKIIRDGLNALFNTEQDFGGLPTQIILVPSLQDAHHEFVYPQPPFGEKEAISTIFFDEKVGQFDIGSNSRKRVHLMPNPCMFRVNETLFAVTSNDILYSLSSEEVSQGRADNRLSRLYGHTLQQQSLCPLFPPSVNSSFQVDYRQSAHFTMKVAPDVLIAPSKLTQLARESSGTLVINPGTLTKGTAGGTYAEMNIHPFPEAILEEAEKKEQSMPHVVHSRAQVSIMRI